MNLSKYVDALRSNITTAASLGDEKAQQIAAALASALEPSIKLALMSALSDLAAEISADLPDRTVEVRLNGADVTVVTVHQGQPAGGFTGAAGFAGAAPTDPFADFEQAIDDVTGNITRVTLRLVDHIKARAEEAADANGVSLNSWLGHAIRGALRDQGRWAWEPPHKRTYRERFEQEARERGQAPADSAAQGPVFTKPAEQNPTPQTPTPQTPNPQPADPEAGATATDGPQSPRPDTGNPGTQA